MLSQVEDKLVKLNNERYIIDCSKSDGSSVFGGKWSEESKGSRHELSNSQNLNLFYEWHRAEQVAQRQANEESKQLDR